MAHMTSPDTITSAQGSQPTLGGLRIGIIDAATHDGVSKARLLLRPASGDHAVTMTVGDALDVPGHGTLVLEEVMTDTGDDRPRVRLRLEHAE
jgi:hypothetical protein